MQRLDRLYFNSFIHSFIHSQTVVRVDDRQTLSSVIVGVDAVFFASFSQATKIVLKGSFRPKSTVILMFLCNTVGDWYLESRSRLRGKLGLRNLLPTVPFMPP